MKLIRSWETRRKEVAERRRIREYLSTALVVFHCTEEQAAGIDVAVGPCVPRVGPRGGRLRPLASPSYQKYSDTLAHLMVLYTVLTGQPGVESLEMLRRQGPGTLARLSSRFATDLAALGTVRTDVESALAAQHAVAARWFVAVGWPSTMQVGGLEMRVLSFTGAARAARDKGFRLYCWHGPAVPEYVVAHGVGQDSYEAYRRAPHR